MNESYTISDALAQVTENGIGLGGIFDKLKIDIDSYEDIIKRFSELDLDDPQFKLDNGKANWDEIAKSIKGCDETALSYFKKLDDGNGTINNQSASVEGLGEHLQATGQLYKFAAIKAKLFSAALNAGIMLAVSVAISAVVKAIDNYIHRVEIAKEKTEEINGRIKEFNSEYQEHADLVQSVAKRYEELAKGVNTIDNTNISLSDDEYAEFLDINNQLIDAFPELYAGLDKNGNAILNIGTSAQSSSEFLQDLINKEEQLTNAKIANELDSLFKNVSIQIEDAEKKVTDFENELANIDTTWKNAQTMSVGDILGLDQLEVGDNTELQNILSKSIQQLQDELHDKLDDGLIDENAYFDFVDQFVDPALYDGGTLFDGYVSLVSLDENQKRRLQEIINEQTDGLMNELNDAVGDATNNLSLEQQNIDAIWADFIPSLVSGMKSKANFQALEDVGLGDFAVSIVENLGSDIVSELKGTAYEDDIYGYVRDFILVPLQDAIEDADENIDTGKLDNIKKQLSDALNIKADLNQGDITLTDYIEEVNNLISVLEELGMSPDIIKNVKVLFSYDDVSDIQRRVDNSISHIVDRDISQKAELTEYTDKLTLSEKQVWLEATQGAKNATEAIAMYEAKVAETQATIDSSSASLSISQTIDQLNTQLKPAFDSLKSAYQDIFTDDGFTLENVDVSMLDSIKSTIDELNSMEDVDINVDYSSFENLAKVLTDSESESWQVQEAFNSLATTLVSSLNPAISECDGESYQLVQTLLESMGIVNAEEVMVAQLGYTYAEYCAAKEAAANAGVNLNADINTTVEQLEAEGMMATEDAQQIMNYMLAKMSASGATIDVSSTIGQLAEEYDWLADLIDQWGLYYSVSKKGSGGGNVKGSKNLGVGNYTPVQTVKQEVEIDAKFDGSKVNSAAKSAGKSAGKSFEDGLKEELSDLDSVISGITGRIDDQISSINEQKSAALEALDEVKEKLEEERDAAIENLERERDLALEVIEQEKDAINEQIKLLDKQIKSKQDEIDAINEAAEARKREIDLQKAQFEFEKMQNMRTKLVNIKMPYATVM